MAKIGRNERCPCGSGRKYKHCCARKAAEQPRPATPEEQMKISLMGAVDAICQSSVRKENLIRELGVFVLFATDKGNAWLFEVTQSDCVQLAREGEIMPAPIDENPKTIEVEWSHVYKIVDRKIVLTAYADKKEQVLEDCPVQEIAASIKRIRKKIPPEMLKEIHLDPDQVESA